MHPEGRGPLKQQEATRFTNTEWLNREFYRIGLLYDGHILHTSATPLTTTEQASTLFKLHLAFSKNHRPQQPNHFVMKLRSGVTGMTEIALFQLHQTLTIQCPAMMPVRLWGYDSPSRLSYLLMDDQSPSHCIIQSQQEACAMEKKPTDKQAFAAIKALACFHGMCWQDEILKEAAPLLGRGCFWNREQHFATNMAGRQQEFDGFQQAVKAWFPAEHLQQLAAILPHLPKLWRKYLQPRMNNLEQVSIIHGDCYFRHFFYPKNGDSQPVYLFDFDQATIQTPAYDLVQLLVSYWMPAIRREDQREKRLLQHYHAALMDTGVEGYTFEQLMNDYRLMIIFQLFAAIKEQVRGCAKPLWLNRLLCLLGAFEDLNCQELLN